MKSLQLPGAEDFMWQYIYSTPLANIVAQATDQQRLALQQEICSRWQQFSSGAGLAIDVGMTTVAAS